MTLEPGRSRLLRRHFLIANETVLLETHPAKVWYFGWPTFFVVVAALVDVILWRRPDGGVAYLREIWHVLGQVPYPAALPSTLTLFALLSALLLVLWYLVAFLQWISLTYAVTDSRAVEQDGILRHTIQEVPLRQIRDVIVYQASFWARVGRFGNLQFQTLVESDPELSDKMRLWAMHHFDPHERDSPFRLKSGSGDSGVEWWIGIPNPFRIERLVEDLTRRQYTPGPPPAAPTP